MSDVVYTWPAGNVVERCSREVGTVMQDTCCDYCSKIIEQGTRAVLLFHRVVEPYYLHEACAEKACHEVKEQPRPDKRLADYLTEHTHV